MKLSWILLGVLMWLLVVRCGSCETEELEDPVTTVASVTPRRSTPTVGAVIWIFFELVVAVGCGIMCGLIVWGIVWGIAQLLVAGVTMCLKRCKRGKVVPAGKKEDHQKPLGV